MIVLLVIGILFYNYAKRNNINKAVWVIVGLLSYFVPQLIVGVIIGLVAPQMVNDKGMLTIIGIAVGAIGAIIAYQIMVNYAKKEKIKVVDDSLLDSDL
jgi:uncharacterized membrane protein YeaQ/YmgE (transglycosylase-associated protein family)